MVNCLKPECHCSTFHNRKDENNANIEPLNSNIISLCMGITGKLTPCQLVAKTNKQKINCMLYHIKHFVQSLSLSHTFPPLFLP